MVVGMVQEDAMVGRSSEHEEDQQDDE